MAITIMHHFTSNPNFKLLETPHLHNQNAFTYNYKPGGLWITNVLIPNDWFQWCLNENYEIYSLKYMYDITIDITKIKIIDSLEKLQRFTNNYFNDKEDRVLWDKVAEYYKGIIIVPYIYNFNRISDRWYYGWDVNSGCIWDTSCITNVRLSYTFTNEELENKVKWRD